MPERQRPSLQEQTSDTAPSCPTCFRQSMEGRSYVMTTSVSKMPQGA